MIFFSNCSAVGKIVIFSHYVFTCDILLAYYFHIDKQEQDIPLCHAWSLSKYCHIVVDRPSSQPVV